MATAQAIIPRETFRTALDVAKRIVPKRNNIPVLGNVLLRASGDAMEIVSTDLDIEITVRLPGIADNGFATTLPAHTLFDLEKRAKASADVAIDYEPDGPGSALAFLDFEGLRVSLQRIPADDFPALQFSGPIHAEFDIPSAVLFRAIDQCDVAISTEETRYYLNGIFMHPVTGPAGKVLAFVATDGHKLAKHVTDIPADAWTAEDENQQLGVIIPRATVTQLHKLSKGKGAPDSVHVKVNTNKIVFTFGNVQVVSKLVDGTFPDYGRVIPGETDKRVQFDSAAMIEAVKSVSVISSERGRAVKISLEPDRHTAKFTVENPDTGTASMDCACNMLSWEPGPMEERGPLEIGFNAEYVQDIMALCGEWATIHFSDSGSPVRIQPRDDAATVFVLMPMRV